MNQNHAERLARLADKLEGVGPYEGRGPVPDENFDLRMWVSTDDTSLIKEHACGTTACAVGWACLDDWFQARGLTLRGVVPRYNAPGESESRHLHAARNFFGLTAKGTLELFAPHHYGYHTNKPADVAARIRKLLHGERARP